MSDITNEKIAKMIAEAPYKSNIYTVINGIKYHLCDIFRAGNDIAYVAMKEMPGDCKVKNKEMCLLWFEDVDPCNICIE